MALGKASGMGRASLESLSFLDSTKSIHGSSTPARGCCLEAAHKEGLAVVALSPSLSYLHSATPSPIEQHFGRPVCSVARKEDELAHSLSRSPSQRGCGRVYMGLSMGDLQQGASQPQPRGGSHFHTEDISEATTPISKSSSV